ncbi:hypothetical protein PYW07_017069 [Mythimna separata]|uniref:Cathepsin propeptide inhibitor domain-containing protein n=1 Tax=Mythimna separata TaxID=271217 RepID=A0AAD7YUQ9_MYTSE|nr:hypothetical protein PYW07_017069 [Mythimna separata]
MRSISLVLIVVVVAVAMASPPGESKVHYNLKEAPALFEQFVKDYDRHYRSFADKHKHFQAFLVSLVEMNRLNDENPYATYSINKFSDYTEEEKRNMFGLIFKNK